MIIQQKMSFSKKLAFTYALLIGTSFLLSPAQAGRFDDVDVISLDNASPCVRCVPCPANQGIGDCGENFVFNLLNYKGFQTYMAPYNGSGHGIDIVAFKEMNFGGKRVPLILLHESKMSNDTSITEGEFKRRLGESKSGRQQSRTWLNNALIKMKNSNYNNIRKLGVKIEDALNKGAYFVRTGNLRVDTNKVSRIQFYALTDRNSKNYALEGKTYFTSGSFLTEWGNQYGQGFSPRGNELPLTEHSIAWLNSLFQ